jgi:aryl-alcohol dehydrogenase-like predicted oxidoreductase
LGHDTLQPPFSAIHRDVAATELPWCRVHNTGVIVYSPMASGLLTGAFTVGRAQSTQRRLALAVSRFHRRWLDPRSGSYKPHATHRGAAQYQRRKRGGRMDLGGPP